MNKVPAIYLLLKLISFVLFLIAVITLPIDAIIWFFTGKALVIAEFVLGIVYSIDDYLTYD